MHFCCHFPPPSTGNLSIHRPLEGWKLSSPNASHSPPNHKIYLLCSILTSKTCDYNSVFGSVVAVAFQITFRAEIHVNDVFLFFKNHFWHQHIKTIQKVQTALNFSKTKIQNLMKRSCKRNAKQTVRVSKPIKTSPNNWNSPNLAPKYKY
jgi:hypothetical protein